LHVIGLNVSIKLVLNIIPLLEEMLKKPRSFFHIMITIKKSLLRRGLFMTKCFSKVKTFSSFWMFSVTAEKVGEVGGDGCSRSV